MRRKRAFRVLIKEFRRSVTDKKLDRAKELLPKIYKTLDKAAKTNTIKKNTASRLKSRLTQSLNQSK